ncbi:MAG TPA: hydantoinase B/oxoprolinase family protein [Candidatus Lustribacter sp.]|nr:hydantoinase B/oxoprolinase family protein [Candidatus Lustribacter sp.]
MIANAKHAGNPVTAEIIRNALIAITDEMKTNLMRTAYNPIIYEALDFTVGLFDRNGDTMSIGLGLPMFIRGLSDAIKAKLAFYGPDGIEPGDILLTNDAYIMGSHLNHLIFTVPIFHDGEIVAFASSMAHWIDVGGTLGRTQDIFSEGLQLPIVKIFKRGVQDDELTRIIRTNVRIPELAMGDFRAQIASIRTGERRYGALVRKYGLEAVDACVTDLYAMSARKARLAVAAMPDGVYEAESFMDDDGVGTTPIPIKVRVTIRGEQMTIDLTDVGAQVPGYFNSGDTAGRSAAQVAFKCLTTPTLYPINDGSFTPLEIVLPPGRVISAVKPSAMRMWMTIPMTVVDTVFRAMAQCVPERTIAGHHADLCSATFYGLNPRTGRFFTRGAGVTGGGFGAKYDGDGMSGTVCQNDGDTHNSPVEATESKIPLLIERYALRPDSGGAGRYRGGLGVERRIRVLSPLTVNTNAERTLCAPWGLLGGGDALPNQMQVQRADGRIEDPKKHGKFDSIRLEPGDAMIVRTGGGGGFGEPALRDPAAVRRDVACGYVTPEAAARDYGYSE